MLAHRIKTAVPFDDPLAQAFASRNESAFDRSTPIAWLFIVALFMFLMIAAGVKSALFIVGFIVAVVIVARLFAGAAREAREAGAIR